MHERPRFGPSDPEPAFRVYTDEGEEGGGPDGLWQYGAETLADAVDCAWSLFLDGCYAAAYVKRNGREVFRVDEQLLAGASPEPRARLSALASR